MSDERPDYTAWDDLSSEIQKHLIDLAGIIMLRKNPLIQLMPWELFCDVAANTYREMGVHRDILAKAHELQHNSKTH
jgi:hypothetical protein